MLMDFSTASLRLLLQECPEHMVSLLKTNSLTFATTANVFEVARGNDADMAAVCEICSSDPRPEVRALAIAEMMNVQPWEHVARQMSTWKSL